MDKDRVEGKVKDIAGRVQRQVGEWTGDTKDQAEGTAKQAPSASCSMDQGAPGTR